MPLYDAVADLPLEVDSYELERLELVVTPTFTRVTTVVHLQGGGEEGIGEDVTYTTPTTIRRRGTCRSRARTRSTRTRQLLDGLELFAREPEMEASRDYRRWAFESAALDLALRQAGRSLADAVGREPRPLTFVASMHFGDPPSIEPVLKWREAYPGLRFKLDPTSDWGRRADRRAREPRRSSTRSTSRASTRGRRSTSPPIRSSTGALPRRSQGPGSRTRRSPTRPGRSWRSTRPA